MYKRQDDLVVRIKKINIRTTQIQTWEGNVLVIPNTILTRDKVENWSHGSKLTRFIIHVTVAYGSNTELVKDLLKEAANGHPKVKKTHQVIVRLADFGENGLHMELIFWADQHGMLKHINQKLGLKSTVYSESITFAYLSLREHFICLLKIRKGILCRPESHFQFRYKVRLTRWHDLLTLLKDV